MKKSIISLVFILCWASYSSQASVRSIYMDKTRLFLYEKVGTAENLLDNPAQLASIGKYLLETDLDMGIHDSMPYDAVYKKTLTDERLENTWQALAPVLDIAVINAGYQYASQLKGSCFDSRQDDSFVHDIDKTFNRSFNAGLASAYLSVVSLGYAFLYEEQQHLLDFTSDLSTSYIYDNDHQSLRHTVGLVYDSLEIFGSYTTQAYQGKYQQIQELDFAFQVVEINARHRWGEINAANLVLQAGYINFQLEQKQFVFGRSGYDLDLASNRIRASGYFYYPQEALDLAAGLEYDGWERDIFNVSAYAWQHYKTSSIILPLEASARLLPYLAVWLEIDLAYQQNSRLASQSFTWHNAFGLKIMVDVCEIQVYTLPTAAFTTSDKSDGQKELELGLSAVARF